jgi:hypothetical protein
MIWPFPELWRVAFMNVAMIGAVGVATGPSLATSVVARHGDFASVLS